MVAGDLASPGGGGRTAVSRAARSVGELGGGLRSRGGGRIGAPQRRARRDASPRAPRRDPRSLSVRGDLKIAGSEDPAYISGLLVNVRLPVGGGVLVLLGRVLVDLARLGRELLPGGRG